MRDGGSLMYYFGRSSAVGRDAHCARGAPLSSHEPPELCTCVQCLGGTLGKSC